MRAAHGVVLTFVVAFAVLGGILLAGRGEGGTSDPAHPDRGELAPPLSPPPSLLTRARLEGGAGEVVDVASDGDLLAVLTRHHWFLAREGGGVLGGFGDPVAGSPDWLSRPVSIAARGDRVYVLDAGRFTLSVWDTTGVRLEDLALWSEKSYSLQPTHVLAGPEGEAVVVSFHVDREGEGRWEAVAHGGASGPTLLLAIRGTDPSFAFRRPHLAFAEDRLWGMDALTWETLRVGADPERVERAPGPPDPPLWSVPRRILSRYQSTLETRGGGLHRDLLALPPHWPSVRDFTPTADGGALLAVSAGEEAQHVLYLDPFGQLRWRCNENAFLEPVFLDGGRAFVVEEGPDETLIRELILDVS